MVKPTCWVVDMRHYIDEDTGDLPQVIPERVLSLATFFGAIVAWVTDQLSEDDEHTNAPSVDAVPAAVDVAAAPSPPSAQESEFFT